MIHLVILIGIAIRAFAALNTAVINPDGMVYIQQAKAIYHGDWQLARACVPFVSSYPFLIAAAHWVLPSWIDSARMISVLFGSLTLVPLYFLLRRFADERTSCLCVLLYAFIPFLVSGSADLIRDPVCWFFLVSGCYFFVRQLEPVESLQKRFFHLTLGCVLFLMAGWGRPETFLLLIFSCFYTLLHSLLSKDKRYVILCIFSFVLIGLLSIVGILTFDPSFAAYSTSASTKVADSLNSYNQLRDHLGMLTDTLDRGILRSFLSKTRNLIWLVDLGVLIGSSFAGIFYPYVPFFVLGFFGLWAKLRKDPKVVYLFSLSMLGYGLLFFHVLQFWYFEHRFLYIVILPGCILAAFGIERTIQFFQARMGWKASVAVIVISLYIIGFGLGKNIKKRAEERVVYLNIAEYISRQEKPGLGFISILTGDSSSMKLVPFYVNLHLPIGFCPVYDAPNIKNNEGLIQYAKVKNVKYFLWDEKNWSKTQVDIRSDEFRQTFNYLERWYNQEYGEIILFRRK
jgi:4-amino-4-deoxy-L-arabinose transferase-like glycosyltransferase